VAALPSRFVAFFACLVSSAGIAQMIADPITGATHPAQYQGAVAASAIRDLGDVAIDASGQPIAVQSGACALESSQLLRISDAGPAVLGRFSRLQGVAQDTRSNSLFVAEECTGQILRVGASGGSSFFAFAGPLEGIAVRSDGTVYVSIRDAILKITRDSSGEALAVTKLVAFPPELAGKFDALAFELRDDGSTGELLALIEGTNGRILRIDPDSGVWSFFSTYAASGEGIAVAPPNTSGVTPEGSVFVVSGGHVTRISPDGESVQPFALLQGIAQGVAVDARGRVFVAETTSQRVLRFDPAIDRDGDGVLDPDDLCPHSAEGAPVNAAGCTGAQSIDLACSFGAYKNPGQYVRCVAHAASEAVAQGLITPSEKAQFVTEAANGR
jgi:sugar lactone lactonase YvrE